MPTRLRPMRSSASSAARWRIPIGFFQGQDLVERGKQRGQLAVDGLIDDLGHGNLRPEDDRPVHAPAPRRHGGSLTPRESRSGAAWTVDKGPRHGDLKGMENARSDGLVIFGASGDLAYKMIFPALAAMERRGRLNVPVIGVARTGWS